MAKVYGEIGSLSNLIDKLNNQGVYTFNSLRDIYDFNVNYEDSKKIIGKKARAELAENILDLQEKLKTLENKLTEITANRKELLLKEKQKLEDYLNEYKERSRDIFYKILNYYKNISNQNRHNKLVTNFEYELNEPLEEYVKEISNIKKEIVNKETNCKSLIDQLSYNEKAILAQNKEAIENNKQTYFGAMGEYHALKELTKLPDTYSVINNFQKKFDTPIPDRKNDDKIFSVQIDHIVVGPTGIYLIETKNWSKTSIANKDFFSPVKQLQRLSLAMFVLLNKPTDHMVFDSFNKGWGVEKISPKNIILMIHNKPNKEFQYVKILSLDEINRFIINNKPIFSPQQVKEIVDYLMDIGNMGAV